MATMTYAEQLRHPNWQRRRLDVLNKYHFSCGQCDSKDKTLHVHHRRYVKGRLAWEYEDNELMVLCEDCHSALHAGKELIDLEISRLSPSEYAEFHAFLLGLQSVLVRSEFSVPEGVPASDFLDGETSTRCAYWAGLLARVLVLDSYPDVVIKLHSLVTDGLRRGDLPEMLDALADARGIEQIEE